MKTAILTLILLAIIMVVNVDTANACSTPISNPHFPQWVPANHNHIILFANGGWIGAGDITALPTNWNQEWVHVSRDKSLPTWDAPRFNSNASGPQGVRHPEGRNLTLVAVGQNNSWTIANPTTTLSFAGYEIFWADIAGATANNAPRQVASHMFSSVIQPVAPVWVGGTFANRNVRNATTANLALSTQIGNFFDSNLANNNRTYQGWTANRGYAVCQTTTVAFRELVVAGFRQDALAQVKPFSATFLDEVLSNVYFYFSNRASDQRCTGRYNPSLGNVSHIWVDTSRNNNNSYFVRTALHEVGHALGLGETLADLMAETFMGQDATRRTQHNLAYNSTFDRILLETVGASKFWAAAYHSNEAFATLWNETFGNIITHVELEVVRGVSLATTTNTSTANAFQSSANVSAQMAATSLFSYLQLLMNNERGAANTSSDVLASAQTNLTNLVNTYVSFAERNNIAASHSVLNWVIESHHARIS